MYILLLISERRQLIHRGLKTGYNFFEVSTEKYIRNFHFSHFGCTSSSGFPETFNFFVHFVNVNNRPTHYQDRNVTKDNDVQNWGKEVPERPFGECPGHPPESVDFAQIGLILNTSGLTLSTTQGSRPGRPFENHNWYTGSPPFVLNLDYYVSVDFTISS